MDSFTDPFKDLQCKSIDWFLYDGEHWPLNGLIYSQTLGESFFQTFLVGCFFKEIILNKKLRVL